jgi:hypothetical protein
VGARFAVGGKGGGGMQDALEIRTGRERVNEWNCHEWLRQASATDSDDDRKRRMERRGCWMVCGRYLSLRRCTSGEPGGALEGAWRKYPYLRLVPQLGLLSRVYTPHLGTPLGTIYNHLLACFGPRVPTSNKCRYQRGTLRQAADNGRYCFDISDRLLYKNTAIDASTLQTPTQPCPRPCHWTHSYK